MVGVLIVNGNPIILDQVSSISKVYIIPEGFVGFQPSYSIIRSVSEEYKVGQAYFFISFLKENSRWHCVFIYNSEEEARDALYKLVDRINNVLSSIPKLNI